MCLQIKLEVRCVNKGIFSLKVILPIMLFFVILAIYGYSSYEGSAACYVLFNFIWLSVFLYTCLVSTTYVYFFSVIMLFTGVWLKFIMLMSFGVDLIEPVGHWYEYQNSLAWDRVLIVSFTAILGFFFASVLFVLIKISVGRKKVIIRTQKCLLSWYFQKRHLALCFIIFLSIGLNIINIIYRINVAGMQPIWVLPFHLNVALPWLMNIVVPFCMVIFIDLDQKLKIRSKKLIYIYISLACFTAITALSRSMFICWVIPLFVVFLKINYNTGKSFFGGITKNKKSIIGCLVLLIILLFAVSISREYCYQHEQRNTNYDQLDVGKFIELKKLFISRWIGFEGIMATTSYPVLGTDFFWRGLTEKPSHDDAAGMYTKEVADLNYHYAGSTLVFTTIPGIVGILNYSGSLIVIFFGCFFVMSMLILFEYMSYIALGGRYFAALLGFFMAYNCVSGLSVPYHGLVTLCKYAAVVVLLVLASCGWNESRLGCTAKKINNLDKK